MLPLRAAALTLLALLGLHALPLRADVVGTVANCKTEAHCQRGTNSIPSPLSNGSDVRTGDTLTTDPGGQLFVNFDDRTVVKLLKNSRLMIRQLDEPEGGSRTVLDLPGGTVHAYALPLAGGHIEVVTPLGVVKTIHTEFVVSYEPSTDRMQVVGVNGTSDVIAFAQCAGGRSVRLFARQVTTISRGGCPTTPHFLDEASFQQIVTDGAFINSGQTETLARRDGPDTLPVDLSPPFKPFGPHTVFDGTDCTTPADCLKPPFVPPGGLDVEF